MESKFWIALKDWIFDPTVGKIIIVIAGFVVISVLALVVQRVYASTTLTVLTALSRQLNYHGHI